MLNLERVNPSLKKVLSVSIAYRDSYRVPYSRVDVLRHDFVIADTVVVDLRFKYATRSLK